MQSNGFPCKFYLFFRDLMCSQELTGRVCAIDFEAFVWAREFLNETEIVKCGRDVEKFRIEAKLSLTAQLSREQVRFDIWSFNPSGSIVVSLQGMRHDRNTAISDMERERPFPVNGNNGALKRQGFPWTLNETWTI